MHIVMKKIILIIVLAKQLPEIHSIETSEPASILRPRDYNPHPYLNSVESENVLEQNLAENNYKFLNNFYNQGPIQFPRNDENVKRLPHPYAKLVLQDREKKTHRFGGVGDKQTLKIAFNALARHAKRVLKQDYNEIDIQEQESAPSKKHYAFSYTVKDKASGDDFSHTQQQKDGAVKGSYNVQLPDGRMQIVNYIADNNGYRAEVSYEGEEKTLNTIQTPTYPTRVTTETPAYQYYTNVQQQNYVQKTASHHRYYPKNIAIENVKIHNYNESPHAKVQTITPYFVVSTTPATPTILQTNSLAPAGNIVSTTPIYHDINVTPFHPSTSPLQLRTNPNYQQPNLKYDYNYETKYYNDNDANIDEMHQYYKRSIDKEKISNLPNAKQY